MSVRSSVAVRRFAAVRQSSLRFAARAAIVVADRTENHQSNHAIWPLLIATLFVGVFFGTRPAYSQTIDSSGARPDGTTSSVTQIPLEKSRQAIIECRQKRMNGELSSYADSARCAKLLIFEAWKAANYPYMDLITDWLNAREAASEKVDQKLISPEQFEREMAKLTLRLTKEEQRRRAGLPPSANNTLRLQLQPPPPSNAAGGSAATTSRTQKPTIKKNAGLRTPAANAYTDPSQGTTVAFAESFSQFDSPKRLVNKSDPAAAAAKDPAHLVAPSDVAQPQQAAAAMVPRLPAMLTEPELPTESPQGVSTLWLLLGAIGGGMVGAAIVWLVAGSGTGRAHATPTRKEETNQPRRYNWASVHDNRYDDRAPAYDDRWAYSRDREESDPPWRHLAASAYDDRWDSRERQADLPLRHNRAPAYDNRRDSRERQEADLPSRYNGASAYDALWHALRDGEEADQGRDYNWFSYGNR